MSITLPAATVEIGGNVQLSARNARGDVSWSSSEPSVATVVSTGFVTAVGPGSSRITAQTATQSASTEITVPAPPAIRLAASTVSFTARAGAANPSAISVAVTNAGPGVLQGLTVDEIRYAAGQPGGWLSATLSATTATSAQSSSLQVSASVTGVTPGVYTSTIVVAAANAPNSPQNISVTFTVTAAPTIELSATTATLTAIAGGANPLASPITVTSGATDPATGLAATIAYGQPGHTGWLSATLSALSTPSVLTLQATTGARPAGTYTATITLTSPDASNAPRTVLVAFTVSEPPRLDVSATTIVFGADLAGASPASQVVQITNGGGGALSGLSTNVQYASGAGWLSAALNTTSAPTSLTLQANPAGLAAGAYIATVRISAPGASNTPRDISVTLTVSAGPLIVVAPTSLSFLSSPTTSPAPQTVVVTNGGGGALSGLSTSVQYAGTGGWLTVTLNTTTAPATLTVQPSHAGLSAGSYAATVRVNSAQASNSPVSIAVTYVVTQQPTIALSATTAAFTGVVGGGGGASPVLVNITNSGGGSLASLSANISYSSGAGWLTATLSMTTAPATLTITPTTGGLPAGSYAATVRISAPGASNTPRDISVTLTVSAGPLLVVAPSSLSFTSSTTSSPAAQLVAVTNGGGGALSGLSTSVQYAGTGGWLTATLNTSTAPATLTVQPSHAGLSAGSYTATIRVNSAQASNSPVSIAVTYVVATPPAIALSTTSAAFAAVSGAGNPAPALVSISNAGGGALTSLATSIAYASGSGWLTATLNTTTAPATLTLTPSAGALAAGTYSATVNVLSPVATNSPRSIAVTLNIASPTIGLSATSRAASAGQGNGNIAVTSVAVSNTGVGTLTGLSAALTYLSGPSTGWLTATLNSTTAPATLSLVPTAGTPAAPRALGTYTARVRITSPVAGNDPQDITITFTVGLSLANSGVFTAIGGACTACHVSGASPPNLSTAALWRSNLVDVDTKPTLRGTYPLAGTHLKRIVAGSATQSYLTYQLAGSVGAYRMPPLPTPLLSLTTRNLISNWINDGAHP